MVYSRSKLPIDRGWAWIILIAVFATMFIVLGQMKCYGIFFVLLQQRFNSTSSVTSTVFLCQEVAFSLTAFTLSTVGHKMSYRLTTFTGAVLATCMYVVIGFAKTIDLAFFCSIGIGISTGFIYPSAYAIVSIYFDRRRGLANSICNSGLSMGGLVLAPFYTLIMETYGYTGTYIYVAAVHLNVTVAAMLFRPIDFYSRPMKTIGNAERTLIGSNVDDDVDDDVEREGRDIISKKKATIHDDIPKDNTEQYKVNDGGYPHEPVKCVDRNEPVHIDYDRPNYHSDQAETCNQNEPVGKDHSDAEDRSELSKREKQCKTRGENGNNAETGRRRSKVKRFLSKCIHLDLLKDSSFIYYVVANVFLCAGNSMVPGYVPPHAFERGVSPEQISILISGPAIIDLIFRPIFGFISDTGWVRRTTMVAMSSGIIGVACQLFYLMTNFERILPFSLLIGLCQGIYYSLFVVVLLEIIEMEQLKSALGFTCFIKGLTNAVSLLLAGLIRDYSGSYIATYHFIGSLLLAGALMIYFLPTVHKRSFRIRNKKVDKSES